MKKIVFLGTGIIGAGLAVNAMTAGNEVVLYDVCDLQIVKNRVKGIFDILVDAGAMTQQEADAAMARASYSNSFEESMAGAHVIQESLPERLELKQETYKKIQAITGPETLICSSTTGLMPSDLQEGALYPSRIIIGHPYNPSYILPLVEIVKGKHTTQAEVDEAYSLYESWNKVPVVCLKEQYGYIAQHTNWGVRDILKRLVEEGICSAEDADKSLMYGPGMRFPVTGQLLTLSLGVEGGWAKLSEKYEGRPASQLELEIDRSVNEAIARRPEEIGNTVESVIKFRDRMLIEMLKLQNML